jgi:hypothetical protein
LFGSGFGLVIFLLKIKERRLISYLHLSLQN